MKLNHFSLLSCLVFSTVLSAQSFESSSTAPSASAASSVSSTPASTQASTSDSIRPFSTVGVAAKVGIGGAGFDVATPLARKLNLPGGGYFFNYNTSLTENNINYNGTLQLRSGQISLDWFPMGGSFRLSAGVEAYNANQVTGSAIIPAGQSFTLNNVSYYSSATDPVHASASVVLGQKAGPIVTLGWGNIVPRKRNSHISVPFELGFVYTGSPVIQLNFTGSTCSFNGTNCQPVATNTVLQQNITAQENTYKNDISALKFYPVLSLGFGYKF
jgi:hypothetical protein